MKADSTTRINSLLGAIQYRYRFDLKRLQRCVHFYTNRTHNTWGTMKLKEVLAATAGNIELHGLELDIRMKITPEFWQEYPHTAAAVKTALEKAKEQLSVLESEDLEKASRATVELEKLELQMNIDIQKMLTDQAKIGCISNEEWTKRNDIVFRSRLVGDLIVIDKVTVANNATA